MDISNVALADVGLAEAEYETNGYFLPVCKNCCHVSSMMMLYSMKSTIVIKNRIESWSDFTAGNMNVL